jgi:hypothetical protein
MRDAISTLATPFPRDANKAIAPVRHAFASRWPLTRSANGNRIDDQLDPTGHPGLTEHKWNSHALSSTRCCVFMFRGCRRPSAAAGSDGSRRRLSLFERHHLEGPLIGANGHHFLGNEVLRGLLWQAMLPGDLDRLRRSSFCYFELVQFTDPVKTWRRVQCSSFGAGQ